MDSIQPKLQHVNAVGQGLIQSAAKHTDTQALEHDLETTNLRWNSLNKRVRISCADQEIHLLYRFGFPTHDKTSHLSSGGRADRPAAGSPVALWEIPGCSGTSAKLAERHRGAGGQSEASICRVPRGQGPDPRTKGVRWMKGDKRNI